MAMVVGNGSVSKAEINVTPLVDVLLVLLIIFMVITPMKMVGLEALVPQESKQNQPQSPDQQRTIVVQLVSQPGQEKPLLRINSSEVSWQDLKATLAGIYKTRAEKVMFITADGSLYFTEVAEVISIAREADSNVKIGLMTSKIQAGS